MFFKENGKYWAWFSDMRAYFVGQTVTILRNIEKEKVGFQKTKMGKLSRQIWVHGLQGSPRLNLRSSKCSKSWNSILSTYQTITYWSSCDIRAVFRLLLSDLPWIPANSCLGKYIGVNNVRNKERRRNIKSTYSTQFSLILYFYLLFILGSCYINSNF